VGAGGVVVVVVVTTTTCRRQDSFVTRLDIYYQNYSDSELCRMRVLNTVT